MSRPAVVSRDPVEVASLDDLKKFATKIAGDLKERQLLLLEGPMGAGKTQFVRYLVEALGGKAASSPTFAIHNQYDSRRGPIDHVDLYRIESEAELEATGFWDLFNRDQGLIIIEWADRLDESVWPAAWPRLKFTMSVPDKDSGRRRIERLG